MTTPTRGVQSADSCPACGTTGALTAVRCVYCGLWFACPDCSRRFSRKELVEQVACPGCGWHEDRSTSTSALGASHTVDSPAPASTNENLLVDVLKRHLPAGAEGRLASVREAEVALADAFALAGRPLDAILALDDALDEAGEPSDEVVHLRRALLYAEIGDDVELTRAALRAARCAPREYLDLLTTLAPTISSASARALESTLRDSWDKELGAAADDALAGAVHLLLAGAATSRGSFDLAVEELAEACDRSPQQAATCWEELSTRPEVSASASEGAAAALSFRARGYAVLGDRRAAREIASVVVREGMTGEGAPEAECHLVLAESEIDPHTKAFHLTEAGRLIGTRADPLSLGRSLALLEQAADVDPGHVTAYWYWADNQRIRAYEGETPNIGDLRRAIEIWERGRDLGPCDRAWPHHVEAAIASALADEDRDPVQKERWAYRAFRAAADAIDLDDGTWSTPWLWLARATRGLGLWHTWQFATGRAVELMSEPDNLSEIEEALIAAYSADPDRVTTWLDQYERASGADAWSQTLRAAVAARDEDWETCRAVLGGIDAEPSSGVGLLRAYLEVLSKFRDVVDPASLDPESFTTVEEQAWVYLLTDRPARSLERLNEPDATAHPDLLDVGDVQSIRLLASLMLGELGQARDQFRRLLVDLHAGGARDLRVELGWIADRYVGTEVARVALELRSQLQITSPVPSGRELARAAVAEIDRRIADRADIPAEHAHPLAKTRGLLSLVAHPRVIDPADWPLLLIIELGSDLVPSDARDNWQQWTMFTQLIPQARSELRHRLGFPTMGILVREAHELGPREYRALINGAACSPRTITTSTNPVGTVAEHPHADLWQECVDLLIEIVTARPTSVFVPHTMESLLEEWREDDEVPSELVEVVGSSLGARIRVWQTLRRLLDSDGRLPDWSAGTGAAVATVLNHHLEREGMIS